MTVREAAKRLETSPETVYVLCRRQLLGHRRVGVGQGSIRIEEGDLLLYLAESRVEVGERPAKPPKKNVMAPREPEHPGSNMDLQAEVEKILGRPVRSGRKAKGGKPTKTPPKDGPKGKGKRADLR